MSQGNIVTEFRDPFEEHTDVDWNIVSLGSDDIVRYDGNAGGASYRVISLSPLTQGTETRIEMFQTFLPAIELGIGAHLSQRTLGQELAIELASVEPDLDLPEDLEISSISQTTTTLSVSTTTAHNLKVGSRIGTRGVPDSRLNYQALIVASTPTSTSFTVTAGPGGALPSITAGPFAAGFVFSRSAVGGAVNGTSMLFENATATNASFYVKSYGSEAIPVGGTLAGQHSVNISSSASIQAANSPENYSFRPTSEYRAILMSDRLQWLDSGVDSLGQSSSRATVTQTLPSCVLKYKLRLRAVNNKSATVPVGQIVSAVKTGTTTATMTMDRPHGLTVSDLVTVYGIRDATAFPNIVVATAPASIVNALTFTIVIGAALTVSSNGGLVARVNGGSLPSALGYTAAGVSTAVRTGDVLTLGSFNIWSGLVIGDYVNLYGGRIESTGVSLGIDGTYRVANFVTTLLTLVPVGNTPTGQPDIGSTNIGGTIIKRTDMRISFARVYDFKRFRIESVPRAASDSSAAVPVAIQAGTLPTVSTVTTVTTVGTVTAVTGAGTPAVPATPYFVNSLATTNGALVLTGTSGLQALFATNTGAGAAFVKLYNKATAPTVGTDVPEMIIPVPAAVAGVPGVAQLSPGFNAYRFALGLGIAITGGVADADTTAVAAGQVKVKLSRTV
jgi:hypothetical protein